MAWLKKKVMGAMERLDKEDKPKGAQLVDTYDTLDDTSSVGSLDVPQVTVTSPDETTPVTSLSAEPDPPDVVTTVTENEKEDSGKTSDLSDSESQKKSRKSDLTDKETAISSKKSKKESKKEKGDSDKESGKKSGKSSPETTKKSPEKKKDKVKTHRRVSSASALSAIGGFIKKGHKRERSDGNIVVDLKTPEETDKSGATKVDESAHHTEEETGLHQSKEFLESSNLIKDKKKDHAKEVEKLFRAESPFNNANSIVKSASAHAFRSSSESPIQLTDDRDFTNMSFVIEGEDKEEASSPGSQVMSPQSMEEIKLKIAESLKQWQHHSTSVDQMYDLAARMIEKRKADLLLAVTEIASEMTSQLQARQARDSEDTAQALTMLHKLNDSVHNNAWSVNDPIHLSDIPRKPNTEPFEMVYDKDTDAKEKLLNIFGCIETKPIPQVFGSPAHEPTKKNTNPFLNSSPPTKVVRKYVPNTNCLLQTAEYGGSFITKTSKDVRECGITDLTLTNSNEIVVVDRHNKLVKVFDYRGTFLRYIGRHSLKQPSRATVLPWNNQILVSDNASQTANLYHSNGSILSTFAGGDLKFPIAHCIVGNNQVAIVDFDPKEVAIYTYDQNGGYTLTLSFPILMECPAYIASTPEGNIVVSDWSCNKVKIFDCDGNPVNLISKVGTGPGELKKPQGLASDAHGHIFVMEQTNRRIQVFNNDGAFLHKYDRTWHEFGVPMCMKTTSDGHFIVSEYQGNVKLFKYMDLPNQGLFNYEAPPPKPSVPAPSNAIWPISGNAEEESESMF